MSTARLTHPVPAGGGEVLATQRRTRAAGPVAPVVLGSVLLLLLLAAGFAHGAVNPTTEARLQVAVAAVAAVAGGVWLWSASLRISAPPLAVTGIGLLGAFAVWSGASLIWSVSPDQTWLELNRALTYVIVLGLAVAVGASYRRAIELVASGFLLVSLAVSMYALGQKLLPGLRIPGLLDLNQTGPLPRLQEPLGYWNALALFIGMGTPAALSQAVDRARSTRLRLAAVAATQVMLLTIGLTYSRGGLLALGLALTAGIAVSAARLRSLMWLAAAAIAAVPPLLVGLTNHSLTAAGVGLGRRELAGVLLTGVLILSSLALVVGAHRLVELERTVQVGPELGRRIARRLAAAAGVLLVVGVLAVAFSARGIDGTVSHAWKSFTATRGTSVYDPHRLLSADSENRWVWWKEAAGAVTDRPILGWGAGSFAVVHLLYRRDNLSVKQPHSVPLQWLVETGLIGGLLAIAGIGLLLSVAVGAVRRLPPGSGRLLASALLAGVVAYAIHALYDWDWDIPGVTLPALVMLGVLAGSTRPPPPRRPAARGGTLSRLLAVGALTLVLSAFAISAALPSLSASEANAAFLTAAGNSPGSLARAQASALLASRLDPLSDAGLRAQATIAQHRGHPEQTVSYLLQAVKRDPSDVEAWRSLASLEAALGHPRTGLLYGQRALALDPRGRTPATAAFSQLLQVLAVPPSQSATSTPLPQR